MGIKYQNMKYFKIAFFLFIIFSACRELSWVDGGDVFGDPIICQENLSATFNFSTSVPGHPSLRWVVYNIDSSQSTFDVVNKFIADTSYVPPPKVWRIYGDDGNVPCARYVIDQETIINIDSTGFHYSQDTCVINGISNPMPISAILPNGIDARGYHVDCSTSATIGTIITLTDIDPN